MDVSSIAALATNLSSARTDQAIGIEVLKKALDMQSANAAMLLDAVPAPSVSNLPSNLGKNINTVA